MGLFRTLQSFVGSSESHYNRASEYTQIAAEHAQNSGEAVKSAFGDFSLKNTLYGAAFACSAFKHVAGEIVAANYATHFANMFVPNAKLNVAAQVTKYAAQTLVADPVSSMFVLMGSSILAANPEATFNAVKKAGEAAYEFTGASLNAVAAAGEFGLGIVSDTFKAAGDAEDYITKVADSYENPLDTISHLAGNAFDMFNSSMEA